LGPWFCCVLLTHVDLPPFLSFLGLPPILPVLTEQRFCASLPFLLRRHSLIARLSFCQALFFWSGNMQPFFAPLVFSLPPSFCHRDCRRTGLPCSLCSEWVGWDPASSLLYLHAFFPLGWPVLSRFVRVSLCRFFPWAFLDPTFYQVCSGWLFLWSIGLVIGFSRLSCFDDLRPCSIFLSL